MYLVQCTMHPLYLLFEHLSGTVTSCVHYTHVSCTMYNASCILPMYLVQCTMHPVYYPCILYNVQCILYITHVSCTMYNASCILPMYLVQCTMHPVYYPCILYNVQCILYITRTNIHGPALMFPFNWVVIPLSPALAIIALPLFLCVSLSQNRLYNLSFYHTHTFTTFHSVFLYPSLSHFLSSYISLFQTIFLSLSLLISGS